MNPVVLLAPSESKAPGGRRRAIDESAAQAWVRERLVALARDDRPEAWAKAFGVSGEHLDQARDEALALDDATVPMLPALRRYRGVAFEALDAASLPRAEWKRVFVLSNLRGLVRGDDGVPPYKLKPSGLPGLKAHWTAALPDELRRIRGRGPVWQLLPREHADLIRRWERPRHTLDVVDERGRAISHFSKLYRGRAARLVLTGSGDPEDLLATPMEGGHWDGSRENELGGRLVRFVVR